MGGGGKGMRLVWNEKDFLQSLESCRRESQAAFGDQNVILEKYLVHPRHIEIQIMADTFGNTVYLHERDCSLQRRHQKVIEEAPASDLSTKTRKLMGDMAIKAAQAVGYINAGTVEFLLDTKNENNEDFYFCEMNTRLQVEHPVTEMITGQDLVEWQLRIAAGEKLPILEQDLIPCNGHSMEARIYAENPYKEFLPATGLVWHHQPPTEANAGGSIIRVDTCVETGKEITMHYDPMISKLIVHGTDREKCRQQLISALKNYQIAGVPSNIPFLIKCAQHEVFCIPGAMNTGFLDRFGSEIKLDGQNQLGLLEQAICAVAVSLKLEKRISNSKREHVYKVGPWSNMSGSWRIGGKSGRHMRTFQPLSGGDCDSKESNIKCISNQDGSFDVTSESYNQIIHIDATLDNCNNLQVMVDDVSKKSYTIVTYEDIEKGIIDVGAWCNNDRLDAEFAFSMTFKHPLPVPSTRNRGQSTNGSIDSFSLKAPMPGKVIRINADQGDAVIEQEPIVVMEAMKMEHSVFAPTSGIIKEINCNVGDIVDDGDVLAILKVTDKIDNNKTENLVSA